MSKIDDLLSIINKMESRIHTLENGNTFAANRVFIEADKCYHDMKSRLASLMNYFGLKAVEQDTVTLGYKIEKIERGEVNNVL
jgi:hypothetical protein